MLQEILEDLRPARLLNTVSVGLAAGLFIVVNQLSFATLIFSGSLSHGAIRATSLTLFGGLALCLVVALMSSFRASVACPQDTPTAILAPTAGAMAVVLAGGSPDTAFATVAAALGLSTFVTALVFILLGRFRLGNLVRFMPYPVVGGFLAGTGWLLLSGSFGIMTGAPLNLDILGQLFTRPSFIKWLPGAAMALFLFFALRSFRNFFILPVTLVASLALFLAFVSLSGMGLEGARAMGLLLGVGSEAARWPVFGPSDLALVRWDVIWRQAGPLLTIPLLSTVSLLLNASGIELGARRDLDLNRELLANGLGNAVAGLGCSNVGYVAISLSLFGASTGAHSRIVGLLAALVTGAVLFLGSNLVGSFPRFLMGGLVLFMGLSTIWEWVVQGWRHMPLWDYLLVLFILLVIANFGFLTGVGVGLGAAIVLFVVNYSRISVIREESDGTMLRSTVERPVPHQRILAEQGGRIAVFRLQGFLFFGTANSLLTRLSACMADEKRGLLCILLDFRQVNGFDISALNSFHRLAQLAQTRGVTLVFAYAGRVFLEQLRRSAGAEAEAFQARPDMDQALECCEERLLAEELLALEERRNRGGVDDFFDLVVDDMLRHLEQKELFEDIAERLRPWLEERSVAPDRAFIEQGRPTEGFFLLLRGTAREDVKRSDGQTVRLRTLSPGTVAGELGASLGYPALSSVVAITECRVGFFSRENLDRLEREDPALALTFQKMLNGLLEQRLLARANSG